MLLYYKDESSMIWDRSIKFIPDVLKIHTLNCLDIGSRGGIQEFFKGYLNLIQVDAFEPDQKACRESQETANQNVHYFPVALGKKTETVPFYLTCRPSGSSLYKPNEENMYRYSNAQYGDIDKILDMKVMSYSDFRKTYKRPSANLVKIDTQGSELDILESFLEEDLKEVICIIAEVEFIEMYKKQPLFNEVNTFMQNNSFDLFDLRTARCYLTKKHHRNHYLKKLGFAEGTNRVSGHLIAGDALYFRKFEDNCPRNQQQFINLLLSYMIFFYFDHALELIELGLKFNVIDSFEYKELELFIFKMAPKPKISERQGFIYNVLRKFMTKIGFNRGYQAFWDRKCWPNQ